MTIRKQVCIIKILLKRTGRLSGRFPRPGHKNKVTDEALTGHILYYPRKDVFLVFVY